MFILLSVFAIAQQPSPDSTKKKAGLVDLTQPPLRSWKRARLASTKVVGKPGPGRVAAWLEVVTEGFARYTERADGYLMLFDQIPKR